MDRCASKLLSSVDLKGVQKLAVETRGKDVAVTAGAGSGKTRTLVARYISLLEEGLLPREVIAVTFTEKAAREMRNRIRRAINAWLAGECPADERTRWEEIAADIDAAPIGTIHSLCAHLMRAHPAEAGTDPLASVLDVGISRAMQAVAIEDALAWATEQEDLEPLFAEFEVGDLRQVVGDLLARRLDAQAALQIPNLLATWWQAVAEEIRRFEADEEVAAAVYALRELRARGLRADAGDALAAQVEQLLDGLTALDDQLRSGRVVGAVQTLRGLKQEVLSGRAGGRASAAKQAVRTIRRVYDREIVPRFGTGDDLADVELEKRAAAAVGLIAKLFQRAGDLYQRAKDQRQAVDFDDLEWQAARLLRDPEIRARWHERTRAVLVDEFQDTNERQRQIVEALTGEGGRFVVGDAKQSIYRFRDADVTVFRRLEADFRARGGEVIELSQTFRAHPGLIDCLNALLGGAMGETDDPAKPFRVPFSALRSERKGPRPGIEAPYVEFLFGQGGAAEESRRAEAALLARRLIALRERESVQWQDIALLFRAASAFPIFEKALADAAIPFVTVAGKGFYERAEMRDIINILRALADPTDDLAMAGLLRSPAFGLSDVALYQLRWSGNGKAARPLRGALNGDASGLSDEDGALVRRARDIIDGLAALVDRVPVADLIKDILDRTLYHPVAAAAAEDSRLGRNLDKLCADAYDSGIVRVSEFLQYIETLREAGAREGEAPAEAGGSVRLMTVHKAKGLQFPVVVIADASRTPPPMGNSTLLSKTFGLVPCSRRTGYKPLVYGLAKALEQERSEAEDLRTLYVAATRAEEKLLISGHQGKNGKNNWFAKLAEAAGVDLDALVSASGSEVITLRGCAAQAVTFAAPVAEEVERAAIEPAGAQSPVVEHEPLYHPVTGPRVRADEDEQGAVSFGTHGRINGKIVGKLVHEAIRRWCFPEDARLEGLLRAAAYSFDIGDAVDVNKHVAEATRLLDRLHADRRWPALNAAERHHEVPYSMTVDGLPSQGAIDLIYRRPEDDVWQIVDFKTDELSALDDQYVEKYRRQVRRYRSAVERILGGKAETTLCFLDYRNCVRWEDVS